MKALCEDVHKYEAPDAVLADRLHDGYSSHLQYATLPGLRSRSSNAAHPSTCNNRTIGIAR
jgi:hypothetical protein